MRLANGLDHVRAMPGIHDVVQGIVFGKKGRVATQVQVLVAPERLDDAIRLCFAETSTIGLRFGTVQGAALPRGFDTVRVDGHDLRTKHVTRPDGSRTVKAEASDVAPAPGHAATGAQRTTRRMRSHVRTTQSARCVLRQGRMPDVHRGAALAAKRRPALGGAGPTCSQTPTSAHSTHPPLPPESLMPH